MLETTNLNLKKMQLSDAADITVMNDNWDLLDTDVALLNTEKEWGSAHRQDGTIHVTTDERNRWNGKAAGDHNHNSTYAPISHSNNSTIHVTSDERNTWNGKAAGSHNHNASNITSGILPVGRGGTGADNAAAARSILGAAPAGYGAGERLWDNLIKDPLDIGLKTGVYGVFSGFSGTVNLPSDVASDFVGYAKISNFNNQWQDVELVQTNGERRIYRNTYVENTWIGWRPVGVHIQISTMEVTNGRERTYSYTLPFTPQAILCDTGSYNNTSGTGTVATRIIFQGRSNYVVNTEGIGYDICSLNGNVFSQRYKVKVAHNLCWIAL